uniref:Arf-GAP domain-containing protein n=1 Tax=Macrostomum lignano TaxID=282301 RepID=A0A1I8IS17_9PLAT
MSAAAKKKQDEKNTKILRELVSLPGNKHCFDCSQRGPTYVNMTIGSFICTGCSGILRGLNPPHRVKSISMASFTADEMEFLKSRGNDLCRRVWLGLHDRQAGMPAEPDSRSNEQSVRDFMAVKYEKKRYYVSPSEELFAEARAANQPVFDRIEKGQGAKGARSILGINAPPSAAAAKLAGPPAPASASSASTTARPTAAPAATSVGVPLPVAPVPAATSSAAPTAVGGSAAVDLLGADLFGGSSNGTTAAAPPTSSAADTGFANFDLLASGGGGGGGNSTDFFGGGGGFPPQSVAQQPVASFGAPLQPMSSSNTAAAASSSASTSSGATGIDKYAAFADLFNAAPSGPSAFSSEGFGGSGGGGGGGGGGFGSVFGGHQQPAMHSGPINWTGGGGGGGNAGVGINWGSNGSGGVGATTSAPISTAPWSGGAQP